VIMWQATIDESGTHQGSEYVVVSTVLGSLTAWGKVENNWRNVLDSFNVKHFHATEINSRRGVAEHLSREERDDCVKQLIETISNVDLEYVSYILKESCFVKEISHHCTLNLTIYDYLLATTLCHIEMAMLARQPKIQEKVKTMVFIEKGHPLKTFPLSGYFIKAAREGRMEAIANVSFVPKDYLPAQVADMIAYDTFKIIRNGKIDETARTIGIRERKSFEKIVEGNPFRPFVIDRNWLSTDIPEILRITSLKATSNQ